VHHERKTDLPETLPFLKKTSKTTAGKPEKETFHPGLHPVLPKIDFS
jgi:hypothetical protein